MRGGDGGVKPHPTGAGTVRASTHPTGVGAVWDADPVGWGFTPPSRSYQTEPRAALAAILPGKGPSPPRRVRARTHRPAAPKTKGRLAPPLPPSHRRQDVILELVPELVLLHLAGRPQRDRLDEDHIIGQPPFGDLAVEPGQHVLFRHLGIGFLHHHQQRALVPFRVMRGDAGGHGDAGMAHGDVLEVDRGNPLTARLDHVLGPVGDLHEPVRVDGRDVARREPAQPGIVEAQDVLAMTVVIAVDDPGTADQQFARGLAVPGQFLAVRPDDLHVDAIDGAALFGEDGVAILALQPLLTALQRADGAQGRHLGHAPGVQHLHVVLLVEGAQHGGRAGRAADHRAPHGREAEPVGLGMGQKPLPDGRHAGGKGHALALEQVVERLAVHRRAREDDLGAGHRRGVGQAPGVDVEHRHHRQDRVARAEVQRIGRHRGIGVQHRRAVGIEHPLGVARGARGIAQRRGEVLVQLRPVIGVRGLRQQVLVTDQPRDLGRGRHMRAVRHQDEMLDGGVAGGRRLDQRQEGDVEEQRLIARVIGDPHQLIGMQPRVQRVQHHARARGPVIQLHMPVGVPGQRCHPLRLLDAQPLQRIGDAARAAGDAAPGRAVNLALRTARDDLAVAVVSVGMHQQAGNQQRLAHHLPKHSRSSLWVSYA